MVFSRAVAALGRRTSLTAEEGEAEKAERE
jgi:hypothetical protein